MRHAIIYVPKAEKQIRKLPRAVQERILNTVERARIRPHAHVKRLVASPFYALRAGDYRIIMDIREGELLILVLEIGKRSDSYKR